MKRITKNEIEYHGKHLRSLCHAGDMCGCTAIFCDGCPILKMYRTLAALGDYAEKIESIVSLENAADINDYIKKIDAIVRRQQPMKPSFDGLDDQDVVKCPNCGFGLRAADDPFDDEDNYCPDCGQKLQWSSTDGNSTKTGIHASRCPAMRIESENLDILASRLLSEYMGREIRARYSQAADEHPDYWGLRIDETPLSQDELELLFTVVEADDDAKSSTDIGLYPVVEICRGVAEALVSRELPINVVHSIGCTHGVWFFGESESVKV